MPSVVGKSEKEIFGVLRERIWKRINGWGEKTLSTAGKEVLIKAVLQSIPTYIMSCFYLPGYLLDSIEAAIRGFWWGSDTQKRRMAWLACDRMCFPKKQGGMGFRDLRAFNMALLAKQGWRLMSNPESLVARVFKARYFPNGIFLEARSGSRPSAAWSSISKARILINKRRRIRIGNGYSTKIWDSPWIPDAGRFTMYTPRPPDTYFPMHVADLIDPITRTWNKQLLATIFWPIDCARILSIPVGSIYSEDRLVWNYVKDGKFSVKMAYHVMVEERRRQEDSNTGQTSGVENRNWQAIWKLNLLPKVRMFLWRLCRNILPLAVELYRRHIIPNPFCAYCTSKVETSAHVLLKCRGLEEVWRSPGFCIPEIDERATPWMLFNHMEAHLAPDNFLIDMVIWWKVWELRNKEVHGVMDGLCSDLVSWSRDFLAAYMKLRLRLLMLKRWRCQQDGHPQVPESLKLMWMLLFRRMRISFE